MSTLAEQIAEKLYSTDPTWGSIDDWREVAVEIIALLPLQGEGEVVEALRPFRDMFDSIEDAMDLVDDPDQREDVEIIFGSMTLGTMLVDDFRRASEAYAKGKGEEKGASRDHDPSIGVALEGALVRIASAGWIDPEPQSGEGRRFRFDCTLVGKCPKWSIGTVLDAEFVLAPSSAAQVEVPSSRDALNPSPNTPKTSGKGRG